jgi:aminotransferase in exopolysaccharide biosynthesis
MENTYCEIVSKVRELFKTPSGLIPLHAPYFGGNEKKYLLDCIDSTFVSSVGEYVSLFEEMMKQITGAKFAIATTNGTTALHLALVVAGIGNGDEVITQPLTFVATANAIKHAGAEPVFVDVDIDTMGLSPDSLKVFLDGSAYMDNTGTCRNKHTGKRIAACLPMHTFGFPARLDAIAEVCNQYNIILIEDAAESLGSTYKNKHTGTFGSLGTFSFNGNKTVTCGGGGAVLTDDAVLALNAKKLSTTAKLPHPWEFTHDRVAYNYRMPNLNAALACAQLEQLDIFLENKRQLAECYREFFSSRKEEFVIEPENTKANYWLNAIIFPDKEKRNLFLKYSNEHEVMTRPVWRLINELSMYMHCQKTELPNAKWLEERVVNLPSSYRPQT